jgi:hypothetical protein
LVKKRIGLVWLRSKEIVTKSRSNLHRLTQ